jgi:hypothetical protein
MIDGRTQAIIAAVAGVIVIYKFVKSEVVDGARAAAEAAGQAGQAVNPVNPGNIFHESVNDFGAAATGNKNFTLGGWLYEKINGKTVP